MNLELSFRKTRKWAGSGAYDGSVARIYLRKFAIGYIQDYDSEPSIEDLFIGGPDLIWALDWLIVHEACHNIGIRHTKHWKSCDLP